MAGLPKLQEVKSPQGIWLDRKATGTVIIPDGVEFIAVNAYRGQTAVTALQFPSSLRRIGQYAFSRTGITEIHPGAFLRCTSLAGALNVPSSVTLLGEKAFAHCSSLTSASIEASIGSVPNFLFDGCDALNEVSMGSTIVTCNLFWGHSQPYEKPTAPQKLILHAPVKAQYRICAPQGSRDPRKTLDVYVPAPLLEEYKNRDHYESAYSFAYDNYTYYAMESSATEATVTITQVAGCTIVVKNGEQEIPSGSSLPIGTKLTIYAQLESGKLLKKFFFNGANMGSINRYDLTLTEPMTFSAEVVATFTQIPEYVVRFTSTGHGHLTATKNGEPFTSGSLARKNDKLVITAHPDAGYNVDKWLLGSEEIELSVYTGRTVFETTVGEAEVIVKTTFVAKTFPVTVAESPNGKVTVSGYDDLTAVPYGTRL
ncbi:leucine-rich repeat domain-containing protein, partial [Porphyromonas circumdentaria]